MASRPSPVPARRAAVAVVVRRLAAAAFTLAGADALGAHQAVQALFSATFSRVVFRDDVLAEVPGLDAGREGRGREGSLGACTEESC